MSSKSKPKITFVAAAYPYRGGNALTASYIYEAIKADFNIEIINYKLLYPNFLFPGKTQYDVSKKSIPTLQSKRLVNSINPLSWMTTARYINQLQPNLIIFDWWNPFFAPAHYGIQLGIESKLKKNIVASTHNVISHEARLIDKTLTKIGLSNANAFLTYSTSVTNDIKRLFPAKPVFQTQLPVYDTFNATEPIDAQKARQQFGFKPDNKVLLFFGYVRKYKGLDILLALFPALLQKDPTYRLLVAGEFYENPEDYFNKAKGLGIFDKIVFHNQFISNEEVPNYFAAADVLTLPYRSATQSGIVSIASAFNKPVIVTDVGGLSEVVENQVTGLIVPPNNADAFSEAIHRFFELRQTIDFQANIKNKTAQNQFNNLPILINEIIQKIS